MLYALPLVALLCVCLPLLAWFGLKQALLNADQEDPSEQVSLRAYIIQIAVLQTLVLALASLAVVQQSVPMIRWGELSTSSLFIGLASLLVLITASVIESRRSLGPQDRGRAQLRKVTASNPVWVCISIYAGVVEEIAYRGVLVMALAEPLGYWPAAIVSAVAFALAHLSSGWRAVPFGLLFALAMQLLVFITGGLLLAIVIHIAYDLFAAWRGHRLHRQAKNLNAEQIRGKV